MTTILDVNATVWKQKVYEDLSSKEVAELKKTINRAICEAGFVTGSLYLLPDKPVSSDPAC